VVGKDASQEKPQNAAETRRKMQKNATKRGKLQKVADGR
jgi:hypothetical protein